MRSWWLLPLLALLPLPASAGRRPYLWSYDLPTVPDGDVEIETWLDFIASMPKVDHWRWWLGPRWAPHETLELSIFTIVVHEEDASQSPARSATELWAEQLELRWRFFTHKRAGALTLQPGTRIAIVHDRAHQLSLQLGWADRVGRFGFAAQVGYAGGVGGSSPAQDYQWIVYSAGISVDAIKGQIAAPLQFGVELYGQGVVSGTNDFNNLPGSTLNLGPTLCLAKGRLWLSAGSLFGLTTASPSLFFRGIIGLAL
jgi:hypothetical protein